MRCRPTAESGKVGYGGITSGSPLDPASQGFARLAEIDELAETGRGQVSQPYAAFIRAGRRPYFLAEEWDGCYDPDPYEYMAAQEQKHGRGEEQEIFG